MNEKMDAGELTNDDILEIVSLYPRYEVGVSYEVGDRIAYHGILYEVIQSHTSQEDWSPDATESLYTPKVPEGTIAEWVQPTGAHDAYQQGDKVIYNGEIYVSDINDNVWSPDDYGWSLEE